MKDVPFTNYYQSIYVEFLWKFHVIKYLVIDAYVVYRNVPLSDTVTTTTQPNIWIGDVIYLRLIIHLEKKIERTNKKTEFDLLDDGRRFVVKLFQYMVGHLRYMYTSWNTITMILVF